MVFSPNFLSHEESFLQGTFCPERKPGDKFELPSVFNVMTEVNEVAVSFFDAKTVAAFSKYCDLIEYVHISDRYSGSKSPEYVIASRIDLD